MSTSPIPPDTVLRRLEWTVLRRLDGLLHGDYRTFFRGSGLDLADLREYQFHDDVRHIDWNVTARLATPYVREFNEERDLTAWFLLDLSASVDFGSQAMLKSGVARDLVAVLARVLTRHGNRVGAMLYTDRVDTVLVPRSGRRHVLALMHAIEHTAAAPGASREGTRLGDLLSAAQGALRRRSLVFVVSDFVSAPGWQKPLAALAHRHDVVAVRLYDPLEMALPDIGLMVIEDAETGEQVFVDTHDRGFRKRFAAIADRRERELREGLAAAGVDALELSTVDDLTDALMRFAELRKRRGQAFSGKPLPAHLRAAS
ncbi:MAG TPA: DUF58 domain-containing protein [Casimicrobiaceae bacterium]|jgi:uncharacterized protein (DUF58 family)